jgi:AraC-like DNA-binding protein
MIKTLTGLQEVEVLRPWEFAGQVELQIGKAALRRWPTRVCDGLEISLLVGPTHEAKIHGRSTMTPGKVTFVQLPGTVWSAQVALGAFLSIEVAPELFERFLSEWPTRPRLPGPSQIVVPTLVDEFWMAHSLLRKQRDATTRTEALVRLIGATIEALSEAGLPGTAACAGVSRAREAIHDDPTSAPTIAVLAAHAGMNPLALVRAFRRQYGVGPAEYRRGLRLAHARHMLRRGRTLAEIVTELGFADVAELRQSFLACVGVTPESYGAQTAARLV